MYIYITVLLFQSITQGVAFCLWCAIIIKVLKGIKLIKVIKKGIKFYSVGEKIRRMN